VPDTFRWIAFGVSWLVVAGLGVASTFNAWALVAAVNARLPEHESFAPLGWWLDKTLRLHSEYRRLYPSGALVRKQGYFYLGAILCVALSAALAFGSLGMLFASFLAIVGGAFTWALCFKTRA
jgi:hypothetical protein